MRLLTKKIMAIIMAGTMLCGLVGCGSKESTSVDSAVESVVAEATEEVAVEETDIVMSEETYTKGTDDLIAFVEETGVYLGEFGTLLEEKMSTFTGDTICFNEYEEFCTIQQNAIARCNEMLEYDTSEFSNKLKDTYELAFGLAQETIKHWEALGTETDIEKLDTIINNYNASLTERLDELHIYLTRVIIEYMENNNVTEEQIEVLRETIGEGKKSSSTGSTAGSGFTNKYGTSTTICAYSGCDEYIAKSGDTNCCVAHSNKCLECNDYIDGDAMYCMDCLSGSVKSSDSSYSSGSSSSSSSSSGGCQYKYSDGSVCGGSLGSYSSLCDRHFNELNDTYNSLVGY